MSVLRLSLSVNSSSLSLGATPLSAWVKGLQWHLGIKPA